MKNKRICLFILLISFAMIFVFNVATPMMTDDYTYGAQVREASSFLDLVRQEQAQYASWSGRSVVHLLLRITLALPNIVFKIVNSLVFLLLSILIMLNVKGERKWSPVFLGASTLLLWTSSVSFSQTILWQTGACNYLWGTTIILSYMTFLRFKTESCLSQSKGEGKSGVGLAIAAFLLGIPAGWCNENTSGGCLLFILLMLAYSKRKAHRFEPFLVTGAIGTAIGLFMMVRAPGNVLRGLAQEEEHTGLYGYISRVQKATLAIGDLFPGLLFLLLVTIVITVAQYRGLSVKKILERLKNRLLFAFLWFMTSYALTLTAEPQRRAYFGAGIFLIVAVLQGIRDNVADERRAEGKLPREVASIGNAVVRAGYTVLFLYIALKFFFVFVDAGADNLRVYRDSKERVNYILEEKADGNSECIVVPMLHPAFENTYTEAYDSELTEDPGYWTNVAYEQYFGVDEIIAIPYEEWKGEE